MNNFPVFLGQHHDGVLWLLCKGPTANDDEYQATTLSFPPKTCAARCPWPTRFLQCGEAFTELSSGQVTLPTRGCLETSDGHGNALVMPCYSTSLGMFALKTVTTFRDNRERGLPTVQALVILTDGTTGTHLAVMDGASLTAPPHRRGVPGWPRTSWPQRMPRQWPYLAPECRHALNWRPCAVCARSAGYRCTTWTRRPRIGLPPRWRVNSACRSSVRTTRRGIWPRRTWFAPRPRHRVRCSRPMTCHCLCILAPSAPIDRKRREIPADVVCRARVVVDPPRIGT